MSKITLICENQKDGKVVSQVHASLSDRRHLKNSVFEDLRGRLRYSMEDEPLVSNSFGPAIVYPDGEEDYYINGYKASKGLVVIDPTKESGVTSIQNKTAISDLSYWIQNKQFRIARGYYFSALPQFSEGEFTWEIRVPVNDAVCWFVVREHDICSERLRELAPYGMGPENYFKTRTFGQELIHEFMFRLDKILNRESSLVHYWACKDIFVSMEEQLSKATAPAAAPEPEIVPAKVEETKQVSLGTVALATLATVTAAAALGSTFNKSEVKEVCEALK